HLLPYTIPQHFAYISRQIIVKKKKGCVSNCNGCDQCYLYHLYTNAPINELDAGNMSISSNLTHVCVCVCVSLCLKATSQRMQGMLLLVFSKYFHLPFLRGIQTQSTRTGLGGIWGNKGGVSARMNVFGHSICFLNCHLPAHMENSDQRMEDFESILQQQQFEGQASMGVLDHDVVFWFGDLNFRIDDLDMQVVKAAIDSNKLSTLWEKDQLNMAKDSETVLEGFHEGPIKFPPTYKFDVGTDTYDTSGKKRKPAWTDRILWRLRPMAQVSNSMSRRSSLSCLTSGTCVSQHFYRSHMEYTVSDHKPVSSIFTLQVDMPLVTLFVEDEWREISDAVAKFKAAPNFPRSSWDWIGLYKVISIISSVLSIYIHILKLVNFTEEFLIWTLQVIFTEEELPKDSGDFILGYYSNNMSSIVGVTEPFQVHNLFSFLLQHLLAMHH
uniref:Inositol polyphosphate-5-phosphatase Jb n=1 Tax=Sinocyclocheilus grahami TaxID=75366 RepID=A0A672P663_SINGR